MNESVVVKFSDLLALEFQVILKGLKGEYQFFTRVIFNVFHYNPSHLVFFQYHIGVWVGMFVSLILSYERKYKYKGVNNSHGL